MWSDLGGGDYSSLIQVDVDDPKSLVDMLLDCWKRNGVKMADLPEIMRVAKLYHTTILSRPHLRF